MSIRKFPLNTIMYKNIDSTEKVLNAGSPLIGFHANIDAECREINRFLNAHFYNHYHIIRMSDKADVFLTQLFNRYLKRPDILPPKIQSRIESESPERIICDYLAGMTHRFALEEYKKLFDPFEPV